MTSIGYKKYLLYFLVLTLPFLLSGCSSSTNNSGLPDEYVNNEQERIRVKEISDRVFLKDCLAQAEATYTARWNAQCPTNQLNCKLPFTTIEWLDKQKAEDKDTCFKLYPV